MNSIKHFKESFSHLFKGNVGRFMIYLYWALLVLFKDGVAIVFEWISSTIKTPGKKKLFGVLPIALLYGSYLFLSSRAFSGNGLSPLLQLVTFVICFWLSFRIPLILMGGGKIGDFILSIFDSAPADGSGTDDLKQWQRQHGRNLEALKKDIYELFKIYKLYVKTEDKPIQYMYVNEQTSVNPETDEIVFSLSIPLGIAFTEIDKENVRQSILQAFQRYFKKTDTVKLYNSGNTLKIESHTKKEDINLTKSQTLDLISQNEPFQITFGVKKDGGGLIKKELGKNFPKGYPHVLITGTTGSGKSSALNNVIVSLAVGSSPEIMELYLFDPKGTEFSVYAGLPQTKVLVKNNMVQIAEEVIKLYHDMEDTYVRLEDAGVKTPEQYNEKTDGEKMKKKILVIDEIINIIGYLQDEDKDLLKRFKTAIRMISVKGRAAGYLMVIASQRLSAETLDTDIKAQLSKIAFRADSIQDSLNAVDMKWAENLFEPGAGVVVEPDKENGWRKTVEFKGLNIDDSLVPGLVSEIREMWEEQWHESTETLVKWARKPEARKDKWDMLFEKMAGIKGFKIAWYSDQDLEFTQKEMKALSKILQDFGILQKQPDNSLRLVWDLEDWKNDMKKNDLEEALTFSMAQ